MVLSQPLLWSKAGTENVKCIGVNFPDNHIVRVRACVRGLYSYKTKINFTIKSWIEMHFTQTNHTFHTILFKYPEIKPSILHSIPKIKKSWIVFQNKVLWGFDNLSADHYELPERLQLLKHDPDARAMSHNEAVLRWLIHQTHWRIVVKTWLESCDLWVANNQQSEGKSLTEKGGVFLLLCKTLYEQTYT